MSVECKIGPIELDAAQLVDGDVNERPRSLERYLTPGGRRITQGLSDKNEEFTIYCKKYQALQLSGLADWKELEWIDSSTSLIDNDDIIHRGWGVLGKTDLSVYPGPYADVGMEVAILSSNENETLLMDYVNGVYSQLVTGYEDYVKEYVVKDDFSTFNTGVWESYHTNDFLNYTVIPSGGNLIFSGKVASGKSTGNGFIVIPTVLEAPFTATLNVSTINDYTLPPPNSDTEIRLALVVWKPENWEAWKSNPTVVASNGGDVRTGGYFLRSGVEVFANWVTGVWETVELQGWTASDFKRYNMSLDKISEADHECKVKIDEEGNFSIYLDGSLRFTGPIQVPLTGGFVVGLQFSIGYIATSNLVEYALHALDFELYMEKPFPQQIILPHTVNPLKLPPHIGKQCGVIFQYLKTLPLACHSKPARRTMIKPGLGLGVMIMWMGNSDEYSTRMK